HEADDEVLLGRGPGRRLRPGEALVDRPRHGARELRRLEDDVIHADLAVVGRVPRQLLEVAALEEEGLLVLASLVGPEDLELGLEARVDGARERDARPDLPAEAL